MRKSGLLYLLCDYIALCLLAIVVAIEKPSVIASCTLFAFVGSRMILNSTYYILGKLED